MNSNNQKSVAVRNRAAKLIKISLVLPILVFCFSAAKAQDEGFKNFRFGLKIAPNISWFSPADSKRMNSDGSTLRFSYGLMTEFRLNKSASLLTGLEYSSAGGTINYTLSDSVYYDPSKYITDLPTGSTAQYFLARRAFTTRYIDLPVTMKLRTPEIGKITYFGIFGFNFSIRANARSKDEGYLMSYQTVNDTTVKITKTDNTILEDVDITKQIQLFRMGLNAGIGAEYNLAGTTSMVVGLTFSQGLTNALKKEPEGIKYLRTDGFKFSHSAKNHIVQITIGVLF